MSVIESSDGSTSVLESLQQLILYVHHCELSEKSRSTSQQLNL